MRTFLGFLIACLAATAAAQEAPTRWVLHERVSPFTGEDASYVIVHASDGPADAHAGGLAVGCADFEPSGYLMWFNTYRFIAEDVVRVTFWIDDRDGVYTLWAATPPVPTVLVPPDEAEWFLDELVGAERLEIRITTEAETLLYVVPVTGFEDALARLACFQGR